MMAVEKQLGNVDETEGERYHRFFGDVGEEEDELEESEDEVTLALESHDPLTSTVAAIVAEEIEKSSCSPIAVTAAAHLCVQAGVFDAFTSEEISEERLKNNGTVSQSSTNREIRLVPHTEDIELEAKPISQFESNYGLCTKALPDVLCGTQRVYRVQIQAEKFFVQQRPASLPFTDKDARRAAASIQVLVDLLIDFKVPLNIDTILEIWVDDNNENEPSTSEQEVSSLPYAHLLGSYAKIIGDEDNDTTANILNDNLNLECRPIELHYRRAP
uniref:Uncharacterized protein n=1 Tax=Aureoumbra lagunensis TaxID=44058 RepID=A0A7S3JUF3_9STRA